ncbi:NIPSNAP family protein [Alteromonadaceae bacterium BrNp21-10]|nr:NIPSNAP family protein [Alteromonadaceae bacterium BrNp21-10]
MLLSIRVFNFLEGFAIVKRIIALSTIIISLILSTTTAFAQKSEQVYYEVIQYQVVNNAQMDKLENYWKDAAIPALNRLGIEMVGVLKPQYGAHGLDLFVIIPHNTIESYTTAWDKLTADAEYQKVAASFLNRPKEDAVYFRYSTSLLKAFSHMPKPEISAHIKGKSGRLFEMRTYESHSRHDSKMKIEMFNEGGEIAVFRETGLHPVLFGETIAGNGMPNLVYILGFESMTERDANWSKFGQSEGWKKIKDIPKYKTTVSAITDVILRPTAYSQM